MQKIAIRLAGLAVGVFIVVPATATSRLTIINSVVGAPAIRFAAPSAAPVSVTTVPTVPAVPTAPITVIPSVPVTPVLQPIQIVPAQTIQLPVTKSVVFTPVRPVLTFSPMIPVAPYAPSLSTFSR